jgi:hypothetical protein
LAPPGPRARVHSLPPILRSAQPAPTAGCSKAPRGLFVLSRVGRVFTASSVSPGPSSRQRPDRDTIRAGRNLPDKEFRYLRTVIVTAAIDRGFGSGLAPLPLTFRHRAGVTPYTSACALAGSCVFGKQSSGPIHCGPLGLPRASLVDPTGAPLLPKLRGELAEFLDEGSPVPLGALTPGHQCRFAVRARAASRPGLFLGAGPNRIGTGCPVPLPSLGPPPLGGAPAELDAASPAPRSALPTPSPGRTCSSARGDGISTVCPSPTLFSLGLGPTNPPRTDLAEETSAIRGPGFSPGLRYSCRHSHSHPLHPASQHGLRRWWDAPLPSRQSI